jgi:aryl-alcohol dehydrogenase-like predicted oxidoreductase
MEKVEIRGLPRPATRIGLGTWSIGGTAWSADEEIEAIRTIHAALERGVNLVDTAPLYGLGRAEEIVGRALATWRGERPMVATKLGLDWRAGSARRDSSPARVRGELEESLKRLRLEAVDLYQVGWLDDATPVDATADALASLVRAGKVRAVGACGLSQAQIDAVRARVPVAAVSAPYDLLERGIEAHLLPYCRARDIPVIAYGALCRGLLSGRLSPATTFEADDLRRADPKFQPPRYHAYLAAAAALDAFAREAFGRTVLDLAVRWVLEQPGVSLALWSARRASQLDPIAGALGWSLGAEALARIEEIVRAHVGAPGGDAPEAAAARTALAS